MAKKAQTHMAKKAQTQTETTDLAVTNADSYAIVRAGGMANLAALQANLGDEQLGVADLDRIGVPAGGGLQWEIPTLDGAESVKAIEGVIVAHHSLRIYWKKDIEEGGAGGPPDCVSRDGKTGQGDPGGECATCPMTKWGSAKGGEGRGWACKLIRQLFIMRKDDVLPICVNVPPSSLTSIKQYLCGLGKKGVFFHGAITCLTLNRTANKDGITYSEVVARPAGELDPASAAFFAKFADEMKPLLTESAPDGSEYRA